MHISILKSLSVACVTSLLLAGPAFAEPAEPEAPVEDEDPDGTLAKSLIGKSYTGDLPIEGWTNFGGGLVSPPIYANLYQREDGTSLVVTSKLSSKTYVVIDALIISKPWKGYAVSIACTQGKDFTLRFIGDARGPGSKEWWTEVRRAWEIEVVPKPDPEAEAETAPEPEPEAKTEAGAEPKPEPGKISKTGTKGVRCTNPSW